MDEVSKLFETDDTLVLPLLQPEANVGRNKTNVTSHKKTCQKL